MKTVHIANGLREFEEQIASQIPEPLALEISTILNKSIPSSPIYQIKVTLVSRDKPKPWLLLAVRDFDIVLPELVRQYQELKIPSVLSQ